MKKSTNWKLNIYQGWKNYYTWNIMLFLNNEYFLYNMMMLWRKGVEEKKSGFRKSYTNFIDFMGLKGSKTVDGVNFTNRNICKREIINAIFEE